MEIYTQQPDKIYFTFKKIKYLSVLLFGSISIGVTMSIFKDYRTYGWGILAYRDVIFLVVVALLSILYYFRTIKLTTALFIIAYFILAGFTVVLPFLLKLEGFSFYAYFLEIQFLVMLFGLILTIGIKPYHNLILGSYNLLFSTISLIVIPEFLIENYLFYVSIVTAKCVICYIIFKQVFTLRRKMKIHHETIIKQNGELLELTNFRKDIIRIVAHDLRNPIHQISSLLDIFEFSSKKEQQKEVLTLLRQSVGNSYEMLENLLKWAMQNNDELKEFSLININDLILTIENQLQDQIKRKELKIVKTVNSDSEIFYSKNVIESVTRNLLINAIKFSPLNSSISIFFENRDLSFSLRFFNKAENQELENLKHVKSGERIDKSTNGTANEIGSGNGLFVCREMLEKNNGKLSLSVENDGVNAIVHVNKVL